MSDHASHPEPPIHRAARLGDLAELERLLAAGEDVNSRADLEYDYGPFLRQLTPLVVAARSEDGTTAETLRWLLGHGADPRAVRRRCDGRLVRGRRRRAVGGDARRFLL
jgi:Ankyrin repeat